MINEFFRDIFIGLVIMGFGVIIGFLKYRKDLFKKYGIGAGVPETPAIFAIEHGKALEDAKKNTKVLKPGEKTDYGMYPHIDKEIEKNKNIAEKLWSSSSISSKYRCAYKYALVAHLYFRIKQNKFAGQYFHFAGHKFREINEYEKAGISYKWSGDLYEKSDEDVKKNSIRSYRRSKMCFKFVGDNDTFDEIDKIEKGEIRYDKNNMELDWWNNIGVFGVF